MDLLKNIPPLKDLYPGMTFKAHSSKFGKTVLQYEP
jgi:hypothetical protein